MVKVEIIDEKEDGGNNSPYASSSSSRTSSSESLSSVSSELSADETLMDRIAALVDIVPPTTRHNISSRVAKTASVLKKTSKVVGNIVWIVTTSALLVALPLALSLEDEAKIVAQEKEMLEQQQGAQQVCLLASLAYPFLTARYRHSDACSHVPGSATRQPAKTFGTTRLLSLYPHYALPATLRTHSSLCIRLPLI